MSGDNPFNNPLPFVTRSSNPVNPNDLYLKSSFNDIPTLVNPYFERHNITIPKNDQASFAKFLFPNPSKCRDTGYLCKIEESRGRVLNRVGFENDKYKSQFLSINYENN
jgi:hypothetical protein